MKDYHKILRIIMLIGIISNQILSIINPEIRTIYSIPMILVLGASYFLDPKMSNDK